MAIIASVKDNQAQVDPYPMPKMAGPDPYPTPQMAGPDPFPQPQMSTPEPVIAYPKPTIAAGGLDHLPQSLSVGTSTASNGATTSSTQQSNQASETSGNISSPGGSLPVNFPAPAGNISVGNVAAPNASTYDAAQLNDPTKWNVTPDQTVEGRINNLTDPNNPLIALARTRAKEEQNASGRLNSSMAETAADVAAYQAALPIAQSDAATFSKSAGYNADQSNQFAVHNVDSTNTSRQFNAGEQNKLSGQKMASDTALAQSKLQSDTNIATANLNAGTDRAKAELQANIQREMGYLDNQTKINLANLDSATRTNLAEVEANYKQLMQSNASASDLYRQITQNITNISGSTTMNEEAKRTAINNQLALLRSGLGINGKISNLNLDDLLDFSTVDTGSNGNSSGGAASIPSKSSTATNASNPYEIPLGAGGI
jgi:hypothetical protein